MKKTLAEQVMGISIASTACPFMSLPRRLLPEPESQDLVPSSANKRIVKLGKKANKFALGVREHVRLGPKITEIVKAKLSLGARILQVGGMSKEFKKLFSVGEGEKLLKTCQCYLSTTSGPIAGLLFISTHKVAFCSEKSIKFSSPNGEQARVYYKVVIPVNKINIVNQSENMKKPSQKYIEIVTVDNFDFWFMGFLNYQKALNQLQQAISQAQNKC
ncbi:GEM-like protein 4 [Mangifera indica]|uniref:GEM-like protein 4 n=1 Tax=Mangifera indica TaxID=29780 RepID=UPI001CFA796B|nr:GEM-like protein 4 [Mangifera indica]